MPRDLTTALLDPRRLAALSSSGLLDSLPEETFDRLTRLAGRFIGAPIALVTLVDRDRQFLKSCVGLSEPAASLRQMPLSHSYCQYTVATGEPLLIEDARTHPLVHDNLAIRDYGAIAYAGVPLVTADGQVLGSFCVIDHEPRRWTEDEIATLKDLGATVAAAVEQRTWSRIVQREAESALTYQYEAIVGALNEGIVLARADGTIVTCNPAAERILNLPASAIDGRSVVDPGWRAIREDGSPFLLDEVPLMVALRTGRPQTNTVMGLPWPDGRLIWLLTSAQPMFHPGDDEPYAAVCSFVDISETRATQERLARYAARLRCLHEIDQAILAAQSTAEIAAAVLGHLGQVIAFDRATMAVIDLPRSQARILATEGGTLSGPEAGATLPLETFGDARQLMARLEAEPERIVHDVGAETSFPTWWSFLQARGTRSSLHVRLRARDETIGLLLIESRRAGAFAPEDLDNAREVADQLAIALSQARLWEALQEKERLHGRLLEQVIHAQEDERRRVARELHDDIGQSLTALTMSLGVVQESLPEGAGRAVEILEDTQMLAGNMMAGVRRIIGDLRPPVLDDLGLGPALRRLANDMELRCGVTGVLGVERLPARLPPRIETALFRIVQEALNNVCRHAAATRVEISVGDGGGRLVLLVRDDGAGFVSASDSPAGGDKERDDRFGLLGMQERAALLGGTCTVMSAPGKGTTVRVELPLPSMQSSVQSSAQSSVQSPVQSSVQSPQG